MVRHCPLLTKETERRQLQNKSNLSTTSPAESRLTLVELEVTNQPDPDRAAFKVPPSPLESDTNRKPRPGPKGKLRKTRLRTDWPLLGRCTGPW